MRGRGNGCFRRTLPDRFLLHEVGLVLAIDSIERVEHRQVYNRHLTNRRWRRHVGVTYRPQRQIVPYDDEFGARRDALPGEKGDEHQNAQSWCEHRQDRYGVSSRRPPLSELVVPLLMKE